MNAPEYAEDNRPLTNDGARRIVWLVVFLVVGWFILRSLQSVVLLFAVVFLLAIVLNPIVVWLQKHRVPRIAAVVLVMLALFAVVGTIILFAVPPLVNQVQGLINNAPQVWEATRWGVRRPGWASPKACGSSFPRRPAVTG